MLINDLMENEPSVFSVEKIYYRGIYIEEVFPYMRCCKIILRGDHVQFQALRKKLCKNNQLQKNDFVVRAADRLLFFLFQYKLNTAVCQAPDAKYPDATERSAVKSGYFASASVQPARIHYLKLTEHLAPVPKRHRLFFGYLRCCQIQSL